MVVQGKSGKHFDTGWMSRYSKAGPRYTSYPTAPVFSEDFGPDQYAKLLSDPGQKDVPLSLYFHIPFCESVCYFCACSVIYTKDRQRSEPYLDLLVREMDMLLAHIDPARKVAQLHFGGGTPTFLSPRQIEDFWTKISERFSFADDAEIGIELDPRETTEEHIDVLHRCGFNRASLGVQDVDPGVQQAIHRIQPIEKTRANFDQLRKLGFRGLNIDLIYGLPYQTMKTFGATLDAVIDLRPDRVALFNFAYLPELKKHQRRIEADKMPDTTTKLQIFATATDRFLEAGYKYIGMDHFALPDDELCLGQENGTLHRNFQGYTTKGGCDLLGIGVTSIGELADGHVQNAKELADYTEAIKSGKLATMRGILRSDEDRLRHAVIMDLINHFSLDMAHIDQRFGIHFEQHFVDELQDLHTFVEDGLVSIADRHISISWEGRFVIRNICMTFDAYLRDQSLSGQRFSKTV